MTTTRRVVVALGALIMAGSVWLAFAIPTSTSGHDGELPVVNDWVEVKAAIFILGLFLGGVLITIARRANLPPSN